jgi:prephenate dehydratase
MKTIAFQGEAGAYSDLACRSARPGWATLPCMTFSDAIRAVRDGRADEAMLACENSLAGRVPEIHLLLPKAELQIVGEHFQRVEHCLLAVPGTELRSIRRLHSHPVALAQVRDLTEELGAIAVPQADTAGAAMLVAQWNRPEDAAIASTLAAELSGLEILRHNVEDASHNTTRFYIVARGRDWPPQAQTGIMTTLLFRVANTPGALNRVLSGLADGGINMTRLESYMLDGSFAATQFLVDIEGHPAHLPVARALSGMDQVCAEWTILGVYPASTHRAGLADLSRRDGGE